MAVQHVNSFEIKSDIHVSASPSGNEELTFQIYADNGKDTLPLESILIDENADIIRVPNTEAPEQLLNSKNVVDFERKLISEEMEQRYYGFELSASYEADNGKYASDIEAKSNCIGHADIIIGTAYLTPTASYYVDYQREGFQENQNLNALLKDKIREMASEMFRGKKVYQGNRVDVLRYDSSKGFDILGKDGAGLGSIPAPLKAKSMER